jgi:hypothetical protein
MANDSFVLRIFSGNHEFTPSTSSIDNLSTAKINSAVETLLNGEWQVVSKPVRKQNHEPAPSGDEVWVEVVPNSAASPKE